MNTHTKEMVEYRKPYIPHEQKIKIRLTTHVRLALIMCEYVLAGDASKI